jgi:Fe-S cluster biogenesis protein NfuA
MNYIYTEKTPNPDSIRFITGRDLTTGGTIEVKSLDAATGEPLLEDLMMVPNVASVLVSRNSVTVTRSSGDWAAIEMDVMRVLGNQFYQPMRIKQPEVGSDDPTVSKIIDLLETRIRPAVEQDGGDVLFRGFEDGVVLLEMMGSCNGCPSSTATLKHGIENMMKHFVPEVKEVRSI